MSVPAQRDDHPPSTFARPPQLAEFWNLLPKKEAERLDRIHARLSELPGLCIAVGNLKGGVGKSTTALYLLLMLALGGDQVIGVDGDPTNRSLILWSAVAEQWPSNLAIKAWAGKVNDQMTISGAEMSRRIIEARKRVRHVVIDTGPQIEEYLAAALRPSDHLIVTTSPNPMDAGQIGDTLKLAAQVELARGAGLNTVILITKAKTGTNLVAAAQERFTEQDQSYFDTYVRDLVSYAEAFGTFPRTFGDYLGVLEELVTSLESVEV